MQAKKHLPRFFLLVLTALLLLSLLGGAVNRICRAARRAVILDYALSAADEFAVPPGLVLAVAEVESDFKPDARSPVGAMGLMQLMPDTFRYLSDDKLFEHLPDAAITDKRVNLRYGACYLAYLYNRFGDWRVTLAAYNAGEGRVSLWLDDPRYGDGTRLLKIPFPETESYLTKVLDAYRRYNQKYNFKGATL